MLQISQLYVSHMCKRIFKLELQLSSYWQNIKFSRYCPKFHIFTKIVIFQVYVRDMSGILFSIFASCEPLRMFCCCETSNSQGLISQVKEKKGLFQKHVTIKAICKVCFCYFSTDLWQVLCMYWQLNIAHIGWSNNVTGQKWFHI